MQLSLNFGGASTAGFDLAAFRRRLVSALGPFRDGGRYDPLDQLVKSLISSRSQQEDAQAVYERLKLRYPQWEALLDEPAEAVITQGRALGGANEKSHWLRMALSRIMDKTGRLSLNFLAAMPVEAAFGWVRSLDGVGPTAAAAVLNFSRLKMRIMVVDAHVLRVAKRYGLVPETCEPDAAGRIIMTLAPDAWMAEDFYELHWLMKRVGQMRCTPQRARCGACPLANGCTRRNVPGDRLNVSTHRLDGANRHGRQHPSLVNAGVYGDHGRQAGSFSRHPTTLNLSPSA